MSDVADGRDGGVSEPTGKERDEAARSAVLEPTPEEEQAAPGRLRSLATPLGWFVVVAAFAGFLLAGTVTQEAGRRAGRPLRVAEIWRRYFVDLPEFGSEGVLRVVVVAAVVVVMLGAGAGLWLALTAGGEVPMSPAEPTPDTSGA